MNEFLDIYRLYAKNFDNNWVKDGINWPEEDIKKLEELLDIVGNKIQNGHIIIKILKSDLAIWSDTGDILYPLKHIREAVFEIENTIHSEEHKQKFDQLIEENVEEREEEKKQEKTGSEIERTKTGEWKGILGDEKPIKKFGTISIYQTIKDYIWNNLPNDFGHKDVKNLFQKFYEEKLDRKLMASSYSTYASGYISYFKDQDPLIISWDERFYSKDVNKYKRETKKTPDSIQNIKKVEAEKPWEPWEIQIVEKQATTSSSSYIQKHLLPHRTVPEIMGQTKKMGLKKKYYQCKGRSKKHKKLGKIKRWTELEDNIIRDHQPTVNVEEYMHLLPDRTKYAIEKRARSLKVYKVTDSTHARLAMLKSKEEDKEKPEDVETIIENELNKPITEETKEIIEEKKAASEKIADEAEDQKILKEIDTIEEEDRDKISKERLKPSQSVNNPFFEGTAEHHLYHTAIKCGWHDFKKGTPLVMIMRIMADFSKDEIKEAIDLLVKNKKAQRSPNHFITFCR